ncbi:MULTISPECIES: hypothetical protein [Clostridioides]|uniref:hypothetical protein n=1 Tax=unclassified Clostridioides TaxID=2635829 RepID=UPI001430FF20|nr:hypothetical protein [Clostridioides sp. ES-S-0049-03]MCC0678190.1 hypothetical protein [Clostridioides sp. ES-W-0018-02]MCC0682541.1 hypothetical protein [Clostridioides sp. ES-S-0005-03]MCC0705307.1 hypothetical protein [Clostridioides sp. ES-S-0049-02]MCC0713068.1 hypothetical protein [Clostridioides sp. ES-W-0017-02]MCC0764793.1 hypothetical protein [Clostridioides sp. ES-S-0006-03]NJJ37173.1 hypothetical protein [Clostridioides difficile]
MKFTKDKIKELIELVGQLEKLIVQIIQSAEHIFISLISLLGWVFIFIYIIFN